MFYVLNPQNFVSIRALFSLKSIIFVTGNSSTEEFADERRFKLILWGIIAGTRGGPNRARILNLLYSKHLNEHQISRELNLDHKTVHHHLEILSKNSLILKPSERSYDIKYELSPIMKKNHKVLDEIISKIKK